MKLLTWWFFALVMSFSGVAADPVYEGSTFSEVWQAANVQPYEILPEKRATLRELVGVCGPLVANYCGSVFCGSGPMMEAAIRTLRDQRDVIPEGFDKHIRENGITLKGVWNVRRGIRGKKDFTGYFRPGSQGLLISRASESLHHPVYNSFGMAGKLFPTMDESDPTKYHTANFFVIDDNGGTPEQFYTQAKMKTRADFSKRPGVLLTRLPQLIVVGLAQRYADKQPRIRQLYPIAALGEANPAEVHAPEVMMIAGRGINFPGRYRRQLVISDGHPGIDFDILVKDKETDPEWTLIGDIHFNASIAAHGGDHLVHYAHPMWHPSNQP